LDFSAKLGFWAIILVPDMLESQSSALETRMIVWFQTKFEPKKWLIGLAPRAN